MIVTIKEKNHVVITTQVSLMDTTLVGTPNSESV